MKSSAARTSARVVQDAAFKKCCLRSGRYDGARRNHFFPRLTLMPVLRGSGTPGTSWAEVQVSARNFKTPTAKKGPMKSKRTKSTRRNSKLLLKIRWGGCIEEAYQLESMLAKKPATLHIEFIGPGELSADTALLMRSMLLKRSPKTRIITNARSNLQGATALIWLLGDTRLIREDARLIFRPAGPFVADDDRPTTGWRDFCDQHDMEEEDYKTDDAGTKHRAGNRLRGREIFWHGNMSGQHPVEAILRNAPHCGSRAFAELREFEPMGSFQHAQLLDDKYCLKRKGYRNAREAFFFATLQSAFPADLCEHAAVLGEKRVIVKRVLSICRRLPPKARGRTEQEFGLHLPVLKEIDERVLIVERKEFWIEGIQFIANQVMKGHARVLCGALNEPVQRESLLNLKPLVVHTRSCFRRRSRTRPGPIRVKRIGLGFWLRWRCTGRLRSRLGSRARLMRLGRRRERFGLGHECLN